MSCIVYVYIHTYINVYIHTYVNIYDELRNEEIFKERFGYKVCFVAYINLCWINEVNISDSDRLALDHDSLRFQRWSIVDHK